MLLFEGLKHNLINQRHKIADDEHILLENQPATRNQPAKKEIQSTKKDADNNLPKEWIKPIDYKRIT